MANTDTDTDLEIPVFLKRAAQQKATNAKTETKETKAMNTNTAKKPAPAKKAATKKAPVSTRRAPSKKAAPAKKAPAKKPAEGFRPGSIREKIWKLISRKGGCTNAQLVKATGWQTVSRTATLEPLAKRMGKKLISEGRGPDRHYSVK